MNANNTIENFIRKQKVAFISSVDEEGFPNVKAMLKPRKMEGLQNFYFSTNTSSMRVKQYMMILVYLVQASCNTRTSVPQLSGQGFY